MSTLSPLMRVLPWGKIQVRYMAGDLREQEIKNALARVKAADVNTPADFFIALTNSSGTVALGMPDQPKPKTIAAFRKEIDLTDTLVDLLTQARDFITQKFPKRG